MYAILQIANPNQNFKRSKKVAHKNKKSDLKPVASTKKKLGNFFKQNFNYFEAEFLY